MPGEKVHSKAIAVMAETGIDISNNSPKSVDKYLNDYWDYVITVCDDANETCPIFPGKVKQRLHMGFHDPSHATGSEEFIMSEFRRVRDEIKNKFNELYSNKIKSQL
jgi:arsenate reductase